MQKQELLHQKEYAKMKGKKLVVKFTSTHETDFHTVVNQMIRSHNKIPSTGLHME